MTKQLPTALQDGVAGGEARGLRRSSIADAAWCGVHTG